MLNIETKNRKSLITITVFAVFLTGVSWFFVSEESLMRPYTDFQVSRGFPFAYWRQINKASDYKIFIGNQFLFLWFLLDIIFWGLIVFSFKYLKNKLEDFKQKWLFIWPPILAVVWLYIDLNKTGECVQGFPVSFYVVCMGESQISLNYKIFGFAVDFLWWLVLFEFLFATLIWLSSKSQKIKFIFIPLIWTTMSFWYERACGGMFCLFAGRGFPFPFYGDGDFYWPFFLVNYFIWMIILYPFGKLVLMFLKFLSSRFLLDKRK